MTREDTRRLAPVVPVALVILLLTLVILPVQGKVIDRTASFEEPISTGIGGRTLLVEEITATWCPTCAEVDPELMQVADSHGSRIALVALHPTDGEDAFMPPASQHRIERLQTSNPDLQTSTPTFVVEGGEPRIGYDGWQDVQRDILTVELERQQVSELAFEVERTDDGYRATVTHSSFSGAADGQLTFLVLEHHKAMPSGAFNPGEATRDRVLVGTAECSIANGNITVELGLRNASAGDSCATGFSIEFDDLDSWSVLLLHEPATSSLGDGVEASTYGVVELAYRDRAPTEQSSGVENILLVACLILSFVAVYRKK